jgi:EmrB/QacA subfamily drug resistance transporter
VDDQARAPEFDRTMAALFVGSTFVVVLDTFVMNVAVPTLVVEFDTTVDTIQAAIALYALVMASTMMVGGKLGDIIGRRRAYLLGMAIYGVGSLGTALAANVQMLVLFWSVIEGLGAALLLPATQTLIRGNFEGAARTRMYALIGATAGVGSALGPLIGGALTTYASWRWAFVGEAVVAAIVLLRRSAIPDVVTAGPVPDLDRVGTGLSILGMGGLVIGILMLQNDPATGVLVSVIGLGLLAVLVVWCRRLVERGQDALVDPRILGNRVFTGAAGVTVVQQFVLGSYIFVVPVFLQLVLGYTAFQTGLVLLPASLAMLGSALLADRFTGRVTPVTLVRIGLVSSMVGIAAIVWRLGTAVEGRELALGLLLVGAGLGLLVSQLNNLALSSVQLDEAAEAAGLNASLQNLGTSLGTAVAGTMLILGLSLGFSIAVDDSDVLTSEQQAQAQSAIDRGVELVSNDAIEDGLAGQPPETVDEVVRINSAVQPRAMQFSLLAALVALAFGLIWSRRLADLPQSREATATPT